MCEMKSHEKNGTWKLIPRSSVPAGSTVLRDRWAYDDKLAPGGLAYERFKARLTAMGCFQREGVMSTRTFRTLLQVLNSDAMNMMNHWDVSTAFIHAPLKERVYMKQATGHEVMGKEIWVCLLLKALYGTKQAARAWQQHLKGLLTQVGVSPLIVDPATYAWHSGKAFVYIGTHVDDLFVVYNPEGKKQRETLWKHLSTHLTIKDLGEAKWTLQMSIQRDAKQGVLKLSQENFINEVLRRFNMVNCNVAPTPAVDSGAEATMAEEDVAEAQLKEIDGLPFQELIGCLWWLTQMTRLDIFVALQRASNWVSKPSIKLWRWLVRILKYLAGTREFGLVFTRDTEAPTLLAYVDASFADNPGCRSTAGWVYFINGACVAYNSQTIKRVVTSSTEAECAALTIVGKENSWQRQMYAELTGAEGCLAPTVIYGDNTASITMISTGITKRSRHFSIDWFKFHDLVDSKELEVKWIETDSNLADFFTKKLPRERFCMLRDKIMGGKERQDHFSVATAMASVALINSFLMPEPNLSSVSSFDNAVICNMLTLSPSEEYYYLEEESRITHSDVLDLDGDIDLGYLSDSFPLIVCLAQVGDIHMSTDENPPSSPLPPDPGSMTDSEKTGDEAPDTPSEYVQRYFQGVDTPRPPGPPHSSVLVSAKLTPQLCTNLTPPGLHFSASSDLEEKKQVAPPSQPTIYSGYKRVTDDIKIISSLAGQHHSTLSIRELEAVIRQSDASVVASNIREYSTLMVAVGDGQTADDLLDILGTSQLLLFNMEAGIAAKVVKAAISLHKKMGPFARMYPWMPPAVLDWEGNFLLRMINAKVLANMIAGNKRVEIMHVRDQLAWGIQGYMIAVILQGSTSNPEVEAKIPAVYQHVQPNKATNGHMVGLAVIYAPIQMAQTLEEWQLMDSQEPWIRAYAMDDSYRRTVNEFRWVHVFEKPIPLINATHRPQAGMMNLSNIDQLNVIKALLVDIYVHDRKLNYNGTPVTNMMGRIPQASSLLPLIQKIVENPLVKPRSGRSWAPLFPARTAWFSFIGNDQSFYAIARAAKKGLRRVVERYNRLNPNSTRLRARPLLNLVLQQQYHGDVARSLEFLCGKPEPSKLSQNLHILDPDNRGRECYSWRNGLYVKGKKVYCVDVDFTPTTGDCLTPELENYFKHRPSPPTPRPLPTPPIALNAAEAARYAQVVAIKAPANKSGNDSGSEWEESSSAEGSTTDTDSDDVPIGKSQVKRPLAGLKKVPKLTPPAFVAELKEEARLAQQPTLDHRPMSPEFQDDIVDIFVENDVYIALGEGCVRESESEQEEGEREINTHNRERGAEEERQTEIDSSTQTHTPASKKEREAITHTRFVNTIDRDSEAFAFEDNPMPILKASINVGGEKKVKVLIDSGAAINLVSGEIASELEKVGIKSTKEGNMRIKVANGKKMLIDKVYLLPIQIGGHTTDPVKFFSLENLPFDILIGNPTLREWEAELSWKTHIFSMQPNKSSAERIQSTWKTFTGQHWRKPISLVTTELTILKPFS